MFFMLKANCLNGHKVFPPDDPLASMTQGKIKARSRVLCVVFPDQLQHAATCCVREQEHPGRERARLTRSSVLMFLPLVLSNGTENPRNTSSTKQMVSLVCCTTKIVRAALAKVTSAEPSRARTRRIFLPQN